MTKQRAAILQVISADKGHYTAEEIFEKSKEILPGISRAAVYNNLHSLEKERLIRKLYREVAGARYDRAYRPHGLRSVSTAAESGILTFPILTL